MIERKFINYEIFIDMKVNYKKSEKELFDEEIRNWPIELEQLVEKNKEESKIINESISSEEDFDRYFDECIPWDEYKKKWLT